MKRENTDEYISLYGEEGAIRIKKLEARLKAISDVQKGVLWPVLPLSF